jgi:hypothetical protein
LNGLIDPIVRATDDYHWFASIVPKARDDHGNGIAKLQLLRVFKRNADG